MQAIQDLQLLQSGEDGFASVFDRYRQSLLRIARIRMARGLLSRIDANDIIQDVFLEARRRLGEFLAEPQVASFVWLRQLTIQILINHHRSHFGAACRTVTREVSIYHDSRTSSAQMLERLMGHATSPSQRLHRKELIDQTRDALQQLEPIDREIIYMRHLEELSNRQVAEVLALDTSAASKRYQRAIRRFAALIQDCQTLRSLTDN